MKIFATLIATILIFIHGISNLYASGSYSLASDIFGGQIGENGWYLYYNEMPSIKILSGEGSTCGGTGTWTLPLSLGGGDSLGSHSLRVFYAPDDPKPNLWISRDGVLLGTMCNQDSSYIGETVTVWEGHINFDAAPPQVEIDSKYNNSNTNETSITITGIAFDTDTNDGYPIGSPGKQKCFSTNRCSVLKAVSVNGVTASIKGEEFSAKIPLKKGLNMITATAIDNSGQSRKSSSITVFRSDEVENSEENTDDEPDKVVTKPKETRMPDPVSVIPNSGQSQSDSLNNDIERNKNDDLNKVEGANERNSTQTIVKGVVQSGGIGIATILAFVIILLILDKFRIIEIKVFSNIAEHLSKKTINKKK